MDQQALRRRCPASRRLLHGTPQKCEEGAHHAGLPNRPRVDSHQLDQELQELLLRLPRRLEGPWHRGLHGLPQSASKLQRQNENAWIKR